MSRRILIAGETSNHSLEMAYYKALTELGAEVQLYDTRKAIEKFARPTRWAYQLHRFFPVESWLKKAGKDLAIAAKAFEPDVVLAFSGAEILPGAFAYLKSLSPVKICWYWADPLPNLSRYLHMSLPLTD